MNRDQIITALKRFTGATEVRNYPTGEGSGFAVSMGGSHVLFIDQDGDVRTVPTDKIVITAEPKTEA